MERKQKKRKVRETWSARIYFWLDMESSFFRLLLWRSWQSCRFQRQRPAVRFRPSETLLTKYYNEETIVSCAHLYKRSYEPDYLGAGN